MSLSLWTMNLPTLSQPFLIPPPLLGGAGWLEWAGVGYFPSPGELGSESTLAGWALVN